MDDGQWLTGGIDHRQGVERFVGSTQLYEKFLKEFLNDPTYGQLDAAMAAGDVQAAFMAGHTLKGVAGNLSLNRLYDLLVVLVDALRGQGDMAKARELYPPVQAEYESVTRFIADSVR